MRQQSLFSFHITNPENTLEETNLTRRTLITGSLLTGILMAASNILPAGVLAAEKPVNIMHPLQNKKRYTNKGRCPNCGMKLNMWARTRQEFSNSEGSHSTCSLRCMADMSQNIGEKPVQAQTALYLHPEKMVPVGSATYVIGSTAKGTMTMKSKLAFPSTAEATNFQKHYGGKIVFFETAYSAATNELSTSRPKIEKKRKKKGKIKEPAAESRCTVCGMYPARYPEHRCQVITGDAATLHFCSSQCLVGFLAEPEKFLGKEVKAKSVWVRIPQEQSYEYANGLYYLVGSALMGPMGKEAIPYRSKAMAETAANKHGGQVVKFKTLTPQLIMKN
jgi:nitrous oxide reductase accessory protein NosL